MWGHMCVYVGMGRGEWQCGRMMNLGTTANILVEKVLIDKEVLIGINVASCCYCVRYT